MLIVPNYFQVNFTVTRSGLEGQLLGTVLLCEKPKLEEEKIQALLSEEKNKLEMVSLESQAILILFLVFTLQLLETLGKSKGNILENKELIDSLNETKQKSLEIEKALVASRAFQVSKTSISMLH